MKKILGILLIGMMVCCMSSEPGFAFWGQRKPRPPAEEKEPAPSPAVPAPESPEPPAQPQPSTEPAAEPLKAPVQSAPVVSGDPAREKIREAQRQQRAKLDNSQWRVDVMLLSGEGKTRQDTLVFKGQQFYSEYYAEQGFSASNYTLTVQDDGLIVWETMQSAGNEGVLFWRGELNEQQTEARGVVSHQRPEGANEDFSFVSKNRQALPEGK